MKRKTVCVQGLGFVGAAMAVVLANATCAGDYLYDVIGIDLPNKLGSHRIKSLNNGIFPFSTTDQALVQATAKAKTLGTLNACSDITKYASADIVVVDINLDVYYNNEEDEPHLNLDHFTSAIKTLAAYIKEDALIIVETTVPPGTCEKIVKPIIFEGLKKRNLCTSKVMIAHSYERVMPGDCYYDSIINYWRVFAGVDKKSARACEDFLKSFINTSQYPLTEVKHTTASETAKVLENSYRATTIAFMEEWGRFAEDVGIDLFEIVNAIRMRPTHNNIRQPGFGVGGYCLTKDPYFAKLAAKDIFNLSGHNFDYCSNSVQLNNKMPLVALEKLQKHFQGLCSGKKILLLGISYRQDIGDTRQSPSEIFYMAAKKLGFDVDCYDPMVSYWEECDILLPNSLPPLHPYDAIVLAVAHNEFTSAGFTEKLQGFKSLIFDANNVLTEKQRVILQNKQIKSIGRG